MTTADANGTPIEPGDTVLHRPSGEKWWILHAAEGYVYPAGWPASRARASDCVVVDKGGAKDREEARTGWLRRGGRDAG